MIVFPNCKINLGLNIIQKKPDGFHDLETIFYPLPLKDILEVVTADQFSFRASGLPIKGKAAVNLCVRAYEILKKDFPKMRAAEVNLYKHIPMGAGLGGGSSDGAFMLQLLNQLEQLDLSQATLIEYALQLGSDCPFFILNQPSLASGRGQFLQPIDLDLSAYSILLVHTDVHISTEWAFSKIKPAKNLKPIPEVIRQPISTWSNDLINDFEKPIIHHHKALRNIKMKLYKAGAWYASMTGSGSSFYGIFEKNSVPPDIFGKEIKTTLIP